MKKFFRAIFAITGVFDLEPMQITIAHPERRLREIQNMFR